MVSNARPHRQILRTVFPGVIAPQGLPEGGRSGAAVWGKAGLETVDSLIVKVTTDTGVVGWGESFGFTAIPAVKVVIDSILAPEMIGRDATQLEKRMLDLQKKFHVFGRSGAFIYGLSAIDIALWDIAGRVVGQPVHQLAELRQNGWPDQIAQGLRAGQRP